MTVPSAEVTVLMSWASIRWKRAGLKVTIAGTAGTHRSCGPAL
jgi:hypothetical protein